MAMRKPGQQKGLLQRISYINTPGQESIQVPEDEALGRPHFTTYHNSKGQEVVRHDFDGTGKLSKITLTRYDKSGQVSHQEHYSTKMEFCRQRTPEGVLKELTPERKHIRNLQK